ncbi:hypothetical protein NAC44_20835 [Allorhizobium sp. BGMRC 0089]|uniref:hypothetical protein n=1 Tax=Allorhizobium sonneratiae TaxID=2934936 RepID=UPI002033DF88|nr:hypothetical protein [Allorhizobium sonneratiae]MCM2294776.1 hypothetical protein [Allorhizobium sonneratiae]
MPHDLPPDLRHAKAFLDRAAAINAKAEIERMSLIRAVHHAIVVVLILGTAGVCLIAAEEHQKRLDLINQESIVWE